MLQFQVCLFHVSGKQKSRFVAVREYDLLQQIRAAKVAAQALFDQGLGEPPSRIPGNNARCHFCLIQLVDSPLRAGGSKEC